MQVRNTDGTVRPITAQDLAITVPPGITFPPPTSSTTVTYSFQRLVATAADPYIEREITVRYGQLTRVIKINL